LFHWRKSYKNKVGWFSLILNPIYLSLFWRWSKRTWHSKSITLALWLGNEYLPNTALGLPLEIKIRITPNNQTWSQSKHGSWLFIWVSNRTGTRRRVLIYFSKKNRQRNMEKECCVQMMCFYKWEKWKEFLLISFPRQTLEVPKFSIFTGAWEGDFPQFFQLAFFFQTKLTLLFSFNNNCTLSPYAISCPNSFNNNSHRLKGISC